MLVVQFGIEKIIKLYQPTLKGSIIEKFCQTLLLLHWFSHSMTTKMKSNDDRFIELCKSKVQYELLQQYVISKDITSLNGYMPNFPHEFHVWFESEIRKFLRLYVSNLDFHPPAVALSRSQSAPSSSGDCNMLTATTHISNTSYFVPQSSSSQPSGALISDIPLTVQRKKKVISKLITVPDNNGNTLNNESNTDRLNSSYAQNTEQTAVSSTSPTSPAFDFQNGFETGVSVSIDRNEDRIIIGSFINNSNTNSNNNINQISKASSSIQPAQNSKTSTSGCLDTTRYASEIYCDLVLAQLIRVEQAVALLVLLATTSYDDEKINKNSIFTTINTNTNIHINSSSPLTARLLSSKTDLLCLTSTLFEKLYPIICRLGHTFARGFGTSKVFISVNSRLCEDLLSIADDAECHSQFATMAISSPDIFVRPPRFDADSQLAHEREKYFDEFSNVFHSFQNILQQQQQQQQQVGNNIESILSRYWQSTGFLLLRKVTNLQSANMPWFVDLFVKMLLFYCSKDDAGLLNVEYSVSNSHDSLNEADKLQIQPFSSQQEQPQQMYPSLSSTPTTTSFQSLYNSSPVVTPVHSSHLISTMAGESQYQHSQVSHYNNTSYSMLSSSNGSSSSNGYSSMPGSHTGRLPPARPGHISMAVDAEKARKLEQRMSSMSSGIPMQQPTPFKGSDANNSATLNSRGIAAMETKSSVSRQSKKVHVSTTVTASNSSTNLSQYQEYTSSSSSFNSTSNNLIQTSTARDNGTNTLSQLFPRYQRFFIQYILLVDNAIFRQLLIESITTEVLELSKATSSSSSDNYRSSSSGSTAQLTIPFATQVVQLKILGKFLGFLESRGNTNMNMNMNSSHTTISISSRRSTSNSGKVNTSSPVKSNTDTNNYGNDQRLPVNRHNALMKIFPTQKLLQQAWVNGNLCLTIPWIIEFLSFILYNSQSVSDSNSSTPDGRNILSGSIGAYQDTIITLHEIQRSSNVCLRNSILTNNILFVLWEIQSFERLLNSFSYDTTSLSGQQHSSLSSLPSVSPRSEDRHICIDDGDEAFSYKFISSVLPSLKILADSLTLKHSDLLTSRPLVNMSSPMAAPLPGISASNSLQLYSEESIKRNNSAGNNAKFSLFATPTKDRRLNIKSPIQKNPSEFTISSQPSTRRTNTGAFSPRPVNLFNQSKAKKLKAIQSRYVLCIISFFHTKYES